MTTRIFVKLILTLVALLAITAIGVQYLVTRVTERSYMEELRRGLESQALIAELSLRASPPGTVDRTIPRYRRAGQSTRHSHSRGRQRRLRYRRGPLHNGEPCHPSRVRASTWRRQYRKRYPPEHDRGQGVPLRSHPLGRRRVATRAARARDRRAHTRKFVPTSSRRPCWLSCRRSSWLAWLSRRVSSQVSEIIRFARDLAKGNFEGRRPSLTGGELGELSSTLESAAHQLRSTFEQVRQERSRFETAVNGITEGVLVVGRDKTTILSNPAMGNMFPSEPCSVGAPLDAWSRTEIRVLFEDVFEHGEWRSVDLTTNEPSHRAWQVSCAPITDPSGGVQAAVAVFHDITELEMVDRMRRDFVINVSHELRTPLTAIQGYTETLLDGAIDEPENNRRFLRIIRQNAERLAQLTSDLMALSQIEVNAREFTFLPYKVSELLTQVADALHTVTEKKNIQIIVEPVPEDLQVECDSEAIHQVLLNLTDNATKYTSEGGTINLGAFLQDDQVCFFVRDTGIGIPPEHIPRLFERFYRVDKARSRAVGGTGLGLAIVKHLVLAHDGQMSVESEVGKGSTFYFQIPVTATREPAALSQAMLF